MTATRHTVTFLPSGATVEVAAGATVREAALAAAVELDAPCAGLGTCGGCTVEVAGAVESPAPDELTLIPADRLTSGVRLACRCRIAGDVTVRAVRASAVTAQIEGVADGSRFEAEDPAARGVSGPGALLGAAIDVGTTTLAVALADLRTGEVLGQSSALNPQRAHGSDVLTRISAAALYGVEALRAPLLLQLDDLLAGLVAGAGCDASALREICVCGNPVMLHLLLGVDPTPLGTAPYAPAVVGSVERSGADLGLASFPSACVLVLPGISGFIGADIVAGLLATELDRGERPRLLVDLGTNGEIVLRSSDGLVGASAAAGPAFEAGNISAGMLAADGAIEGVALTAEGLELDVIGGGEPRGLCGSGLVELVVALLDAGVLDATGRLRGDGAHPLASRVRDTKDERVFDVALGVMLTQRDVRAFQLAVAAIAAGLAEVLDAAHIDAADVEQVFVAGGFGKHVSAARLVRLGMIPAAWGDRVRVIGNTALAGTLAALVSGDARRRADALATHVRTIELATRPGFQARFIAGMTFPER